MKKTRKHLTGTEKVAVLRRHLIDKLAVSDLWDEVGIQPSQFYRWLKRFFENGAQALERPGGKAAAVRSHDALRVEKLEAKLREKNEVIAELLAEHVAAKKNFWGGLKGKWLSQEMRDDVVDFGRAGTPPAPETYGSPQPRHAESRKEASRRYTCRTGTMWNKGSPERSRRAGRRTPAIADCFQCDSTNAESTLGKPRRSMSPVLRRPVEIWTAEGSRDGRCDHDGSLVDAFGLICKEP